MAADVDTTERKLSDTTGIKNYRAAVTAGDATGRVARHVVCAVTKAASRVRVSRDGRR